LTCPESFTVNANSVSCTASLNLPLATAIDDCSSANIRRTWEFGAGGGPFTDIPGGTHIITYTASDECGNTSVCTTELTVVDLTGPLLFAKN